jgi:hypothetical protein
VIDGGTGYAVQVIHGRLVYVSIKIKMIGLDGLLFLYLKNVYHHQLPPELCWCWNREIKPNGILAIKNI